ncbi:MAG: hypothetical protein ACO1N9_02730 [Flavobacterium sp.]
MATITMFGEERQKKWMDVGVNLEKFYDEAAVYGMIKMILGDDAAKPQLETIDKAKFFAAGS